MKIGLAKEKDEHERKTVERRHELENSKWVPRPTQYFCLNQHL